MDTPESLFNSLPRHIRKLVRAKDQSPQKHPIAHKEGHLSLDSSISLWGTIGTDEDFSAYPDNEITKLKGELASYAELEADQICVGNGATELVDLVLRMFCNPNSDNVICFSPSNQRFQHFASMNALEVREVELGTNFELPIYEVDRAIDENTKVIFIENPNQITGSFFAQYDIVDFVTKFDGVVVIDESAIDYAADKSLASMVALCNNVIVIQSLSRAWGLAGLRIGMAYAQLEIIRILDLLRPAYSVNMMAQKMATKALYVKEQKDRVVVRTIEQRKKLKDALEKLPAVIKIHDSETNTLLIEVADAEEMCEHLRKEEQIIVLNVSSMVGLENCIRISVGQGIDNMRVIKAFKDMPYKTSTSRLFWKSVSQTLRKASVFFGVFKKILGS